MANSAFDIAVEAYIAEHGSIDIDTVDALRAVYETGVSANTRASLVQKRNEQKKDAYHKLGLLRTSGTIDPENPEDAEFLQKKREGAAKKSAKEAKSVGVVATASASEVIKYLEKKLAEFNTLKNRSKFGAAGNTPLDLLSDECLEVSKKMKEFADDYAKIASKQK